MSFNCNLELLHLVELHFLEREYNLLFAGSFPKLKFQRKLDLTSITDRDLLFLIQAFLNEVHNSLAVAEITDVFWEGVYIELPCEQFGRLLRKSTNCNFIELLWLVAF